MIGNLLEHLPSVAGRLAAASHVLLGLDYDGTLTAHVDDPNQATLAPQTRLILQSLASEPDCTIAIVSGRSLLDLANLVGVHGACLAGNHGLEISGLGSRFTEATAAKLRVSLTELAAILSNRLEHITGTTVENKGLTLSVHFRCVAVHLHDELRGIVESVVATRCEFRTRPGNNVFEVRPRVQWHKGCALEWIRNRLEMPHTLTVYCGDDETDEDAFRSQHDGIMIKVGQAEGSAASYYVDGPAQVTTFLGWLSQAWAHRRDGWPSPAVTEFEA